MLQFGQPRSQRYVFTDRELEGYQTTRSQQAAKLRDIIDRVRRRDVLQYDRRINEVKAPVCEQRKIWTLIHNELAITGWIEFLSRFHHTLRDVQAGAPVETFGQSLCQTSCTTSKVKRPSIPDLLRMWCRTSDTGSGQTFRPVLR